HSRGRAGPLLWRGSGDPRRAGRHRALAPRACAFPTAARALAARARRGPSAMTPRGLDCEEVIRHLLEYLDRELDDEGMSEMARHLEHCRSCFDRAEFERRLKESVHASGTQHASAQLRSRIRDILERF